MVPSCARILHGAKRIVRRGVCRIGCLVGGEICAIAAAGITNFAALQTDKKEAGPVSNEQSLPSSVHHVPAAACFMTRRGRTTAGVHGSPVPLAAAPCGGRTAWRRRSIRAKPEC